MRYYAKLQETVKYNVFVEGIQCDGCNQNPLKGIRYKCGYVCPPPRPLNCTQTDTFQRTCESYDLCSSCESNTAHDPSHMFIQIKPPAGDGEAVPVTNVTVKFHKSVNETTTFTVIKLNSTHTVGALIDAIADLSPYIPHADLPTLTRSVTRGTCVALGVC